MIATLILFAADVEAKIEPIRRVTPLSPTVKVVGSILGLLVMAVGVWLALAHRAQLKKPRDEQGFGARLRGRTPIALLLAASGLLVVIGVWIDPTKFPGSFVSIWLLAMALLSLTLLAAGLDWWWVRRLATWERQEMIRDDRERLFDELAKRRREPPQANGQAH